jgi:hypothetical protein
MEQMIYWIVLKNLQIPNICFDFADKQTLMVSNAALHRFTQNNPNLETLALVGDDPCECMGDQCFEYIATFCRNLKCFQFAAIEFPAQGISALSRECHQLEAIIMDVVYNFDLHEMEILLKNNKNLDQLNLRCDGDISPIFSILGKCNQNVRHLDLCGHDGDLTDAQIIQLTQGCKYLERLEFEIVLDFKCDKMMDCLGKYNHLLEVFICDKSVVVRPTETITYESLHSLATGCPLLRHIRCSYLRIPTAGLASLVKYCVGIEKLDLYECEIPDEGLFEIGKLLKLKELTFSCAITTSDKGMANLVKYNRNLVYIDIRDCSLLTNHSLLSLANNCPNLREIRLLGYDQLHITSTGVTELFIKCDKLININNMSRYLSRGLRTELELRQVELLKLMEK